MSTLLHIWPMLAGAGVANALYRPKPKTSRRRDVSPQGAESPDAELVALAAEFERLQVEIRPLMEKFFTLPESSPEFEAVSDAETALVIQQDDIAERVKTIPAVTLAGFQAKAAIARSLLWRHHKNGIEEECAGEEIDFVWAMLNDLLRLNEGAGA